jgi:transketolase
MRKAFVRALVEEAEIDSRVVLLTGDLGYMALEPFSERFPDRFFNVGVAEQNMVGIATGLAEAGFIPYVYSIAPFVSLRPYEFIRNGPVLHHLPVRLVGMGGGFEYGINGLSHYGLEDLGVMRIQPALSVLAPADHEQAYEMIRATAQVEGPVYYRIGKDDRTVVAGLNGRFRLGRAELTADGDEIVLIASGAIASEAAVASQELKRRGISCCVLVVSSLNPAPEDDLAEALSKFPVALTVESHYVVGGLGSLVSEVVAERGIPCRIVRCGVRSIPDSVSGSQQFMQQLSGLNADQIADTARNALRDTQPKLRLSEPRKTSAL